MSEQGGLHVPVPEMLIRADAFSLVDIVLCVCVVCMSLILMHMGFDTNISIINAYTIYCHATLSAANRVPEIRCCRKAAVKSWVCLLYALYTLRIVETASL